MELCGLESRTPPMPCGPKVLHPEPQDFSLEWKKEALAVKTCSSKHSYKVNHGGRSGQPVLNSTVAPYSPE